MQCTFIVRVLSIRGRVQIDSFAFFIEIAYQTKRFHSTFAHKFTEFSRGYLIMGRHSFTFWIEIAYQTNRFYSNFQTSLLSMTMPQWRIFMAVPNKGEGFWGKIILLHILLLLSNEPILFKLWKQVYCWWQCHNEEFYGCKFLGAKSFFYIFDWIAYQTNRFYTILAQKFNVDDNVTIRIFMAVHC